MFQNLTPDEARAHYDRNAGKQDGQGWYEDDAFDRLIALGNFARAQAVVEAGCGTGRFAERLLRDHLPEHARYTGIDISPAMLARAASRLKPFEVRVTLKPGDVTLGLTEPRGSADRAVATYLFDLLSPAHSRHLLDEMHRVLRPGGLVCLASLTPETNEGDTTILTQLWSLVQRVWPWIVGGCRPVRLAPMLDREKWEIVARETVSPRGLTSEVVVARKVRPAPAGPGIQTSL
jgi:ubiquinone/menaquinone biosynthesis C-methylase UbiE